MNYGTLGALGATFVFGMATALWCCATGASGVADPTQDASLDVGRDGNPGIEVEDSGGPDDHALSDDVCGHVLEPTAGCLVPDAGAACKEGFCEIAPGCFIMGSPPCQFGRGAYSENQVQATLTHRFTIGDHEVTQAEWVSTGYKNPSGKFFDSGAGDCSDPQCPVGNVTWYEAVAFANNLSESAGLEKCYELVDCVGTTGEGLVCHDVRITAPTLYECHGYRLPTEAEWEYAARAGTTTAFYSGPILDQSDRECQDDPVMDKIGWYCINSGNFTHPGRQKEPNSWGLYDMSGNAMEWVNDQFNGLGYGDGPVTNPGENLTGLTFSDGGRPEERALRSGLVVGPASLCTSSYRWDLIPTARGSGYGFRIARTIGGFSDAGSH